MIGKVPGDSSGNAGLLLPEFGSMIMGEVAL
jgi:hypothetical protein